MNDYKIPIQWIDKLFIYLLEIYGDKFSSRFINSTYLDNEKMRWQSGLFGVNPEEIRRVLHLCKNGNIAYPPTVVEFYHYCKNVRSPPPPKALYERTEEQQKSGERNIKEILNKLRGNTNAPEKTL